VVSNGTARGRAGLLEHLGLILGPGAFAVAALSAWNVAHVMLGSQHYREELSRAAEILGICIAAYAPLVLAPLAAVSTILVVLARAPLGWVKKAQSEDRSWMRAAHVAAASGITALLFGIGIVAPRSLADASMGASAFLDLAIAALVAAGVGWLAYRLEMRDRRSRAPVVRLGNVASALAGLVTALFLWQTTRDHLSERSGSLVVLLLALPAALAGLLVALGLGRAARAAPSWIPLSWRALRTS